MQKSQIKIGAILSYVQMALNVVIGLAYTPVMVEMLGQAEYGLYNTCASVISMLSVLSLGFGSGYVRYYAKYKVNKDYDSIYSLNGVFLLIFTVIGAVALACGVVISNNLEIIYKDGLSAGEYEIAKTLMILLTINLAISFPMSVFGTIVNSNERYLFVRIVNMIKCVLSPLITIVVLKMGFRSIGMVTVTVVLAVIADLCFVYYVLFILKNKFKLGHIEKGLFKSMFAYTTFIMINTIVKQVNWNAGKVILTRFQGPEEVAIFSVAANLHVYYENFATAVSHVFRPRIHIIVNSTKDDLALQHKQLTDVMIKVGRIQYIILGLIATGLIFFGQAFISGYWVGEGYENSYFVTLLLVLPTTFNLIQALGQEIQRALNKHKFRSIVYIFMSIVNIILTVILCQKYGAIGAAVGTAISVFVVDVVIINIYYHKQCNIDVIKFWKEILFMSRGLIIPVIVGILMTRYLDMYNIFQYLAGIAVYSLIYAGCMWFMVFNKEEKNMVKAVFTKVLSKIKR